MQGKTFAQMGAALAVLGLLQLPARGEGAVLECTVTRDSAVTGFGIVWLDDDSTNSWYLGIVPNGGVRDTRYNSGSPLVNGPGAFKVKNIGAPCGLLIKTAGMDVLPCTPTDTLPPGENKYALAVASNAADPLPQWRMLRADPIESSGIASVTLLEYAGTGDVVAFDLKYWAPNSGNHSGDFNVSIEALALE